MSTTGMDSNSRRVSSSTSRRTSKRLLFDKRYGWVFDEWKDPSEEALAGGRGMFCLVPLARAFLDMASQSINFIGSSTVEVLKRPELLSPQRKNLSCNLNGITEWLIMNIRYIDDADIESSFVSQRQDISLGLYSIVYMDNVFCFCFILLLSFH
ncbi:hypothetical protein HYC85_003822 [Camellia sinensis]|uniref:Uncharacterized protein n=1 Tax=Camellia sinensis TaxID=4442 RepID=A0A7J7HW03_CAMSI|nr:hypothetical protein HYC85_003822 [Camellia sinensis]